jgi:hypothetical protein
MGRAARWRWRRCRPAPVASAHRRANRARAGRRHARDGAGIARQHPHLRRDGRWQVLRRRADDREMDNRRLHRVGDRHAPCLPSVARIRGRVRVIVAERPASGASLAKSRDAPGRARGSLGPQGGCGTWQHAAAGRSGANPRGSRSRFRHARQRGPARATARPSRTRRRRATRPRSDVGFWSGFRYWCRTRLVDGTYATRWNAGSDGPIGRDDQKGSCAIAHGHDHGGVHEPPFRAACPALGPRSQGVGRAGEALLMLMKPRLSRRRGGTIAFVSTDVVKAFEPIPSALRRLARGGLACGP